MRLPLPEQKPEITPVEEDRVNKGLAMPNPSDKFPQTNVVPIICLDPCFSNCMCHVGWDMTEENQ